jgi:hypothetical protein
METEQEPHVEISKEDSIRIVRIVVKCSDLLSDYDILASAIENKKAKYAKHELKNIILELGEFVDKFSGAFLIPFVKADDELQMELQASFTEFSKSIKVKNPELTALILMYIKCRSILDDIHEMEFADKFLGLLIEICKLFCEVVDKKYAFIKELKDPKSGYTVDMLANAMSELGKKIMYGKKPE